VTTVVCRVGGFCPEEGELAEGDWPWLAAGKNTVSEPNVRKKHPSRRRERRDGSMAAPLKFDLIASCYGGDGGAGRPRHTRERNRETVPTGRERARVLHPLGRQRKAGESQAPAVESLHVGLGRAPARFADTRAIKSRTRTSMMPGESSAGQWWWSAYSAAAFSS